MCLVMHVVNMCSCAAHVYMVHLCTQMCLVVHVCVNWAYIYACNWWCMSCTCVHICVYGASMHTFVFGGACGACMCIWCIYAHKCVWQCMYVYMVHINASVIGDTCGAHAFQVIFTFQVLFM